MRSRAAVGAALAAVLALPAAAVAQRGGRGATGEKPKAPIVQTVGCAERKPAVGASADTWWLSKAAEPRPATAGLFNTTQIDAAKAAPLGSGAFQLIGVADFLDTEGLLRTGQRKEFTTPENANATGQLQHGRKVLVKGLLISAGDARRLNLLSVIALADTCG